LSSGTFRYSKSPRRPAWHLPSVDLMSSQSAFFRTPGSRPLCYFLKTHPVTLLYSAQACRVCASLSCEVAFWQVFFWFRAVRKLFFSVFFFDLKGLFCQGAQWTSPFVPTLRAVLVRPFGASPPFLSPFVFFGRPVSFSGTCFSRPGIPKACCSSRIFMAMMALITAIAVFFYLLVPSCVPRFIFILSGLVFDYFSRLCSFPPFRSMPLRRSDLGLSPLPCFNVSVPSFHLPEQPKQLFFILTKHHT